MNERPLIAFTLLTQMAVGAFVTIVAIELGAAGLASQASTETLTNRALFVTVPAVAVGLLSSLLHLGAPRNAWRVLANVRSSWLSREILFALFFCGFAGVFAVLRWSDAGSSQLRSSVALAAGLSGVAFIYAMAHVYRLRTVTSWDTPLTTMSFFATTMLLGSLGVGALIALAPGVPDVIATVPLHRLALVGAGCFAVEIAVEEHGTPHGGRRLLLLAGLASSSIQVLSDGRATPALVLAFGVAVATQVLGRYRFYAALAQPLTRARGTQP